MNQDQLQNQPGAKFQLPGWADKEYRFEIFTLLYYINAWHKVNMRLTNNEPIVIKFLDTSLRDGEQTNGMAMSETTKITLTELLCELGIEFLEVGFPASANDHTKAVSNSGMRNKYPNTAVTGLARTLPADITASQIALEPVNPGCRVIHTFIATSPEHRKLKLGGKSIPEICTMVEDSVRLISEPKENNTEDKYIAMFSPEDATNTPIKDLKLVIEAAVKGGATIINIPDTIGTAQPSEVGNLIKILVIHCEFLQTKYAVKDRIIVSYHGHNDSDLATACTLEAIKNGAEMVQGTLNGIGERSGNTAIYKVLRAMVARPDIYSKYVYKIGISKIATTLKEFDRLLGTNVYPEFERQFIHASGIHQAQVAKAIIETLQNNPNYTINNGLIYDETGSLVQIHDVYQPIRSETFGSTPEFYGIVLTKHSGIAGVKAVSRLMGYNSGAIDTEFMKKFGEYLNDLLENHNIKVCRPEMLAEFLYKYGIPKLTQK